jgi:hypothetical protein
MPLRGRKLEDDAVARWHKRGDALEAGSRLMTDKPDPDQWTPQDYKLWRYALAVSRRLEKIH